MRAHVRELRRRLREEGARGVLAFVATGARAQLSKRETQLVIVKRLDEVAVPKRRGQVRLEDVERRHVPALQALNRERGDDEGDARFAHDLAAGYGGPRHRDMDELGLGIELGPGDVYGYDLYVDKQHRAGGTVNDFLFQIETALRERGFERLWGYVAADNAGARWTYRARGYVPMWKVERTRRLWRWSNRIVRLEGLKPE